MKITVLGTGGWGIALANHCHRLGHTVQMWTPFEEEASELLLKRESERFLKGVKIPENIKISTDISTANDSDITIIAVPSFAVRQTAARLKGINCGIIVNVAKGFEKDTLLRLSEVITSELPHSKVAVISGPSHAEEVAVSVPTAVVVSSEDVETAGNVQNILMGNNLRLYTNNDVIGVEIGGAVKNVIAVAAGITNGLRIGDNSRAALITRGLAEITRLGKAIGANENTFTGLSGIGDLIVTCMSLHSRNNRFGNLVGEGMAVKEALEKVGTVEGYYATENVYRLSKIYGVEMPITEQCYNILYNNASPEEVLKMLMSRPGKSENEFMG